MKQVTNIHRAYENTILDHKYVYCHYKKFDYALLKYIWYERQPGMGSKDSYNDVIIMCDTETSKKRPDEPYIEHGKVKYKTDNNHIVSWTISIRAYHHNICTLWGRKPSSMIECMTRIHASMSGLITIMYIHNLPYDYTFLRQYMYERWDHPIKMLNIKPHYPIYMEFLNGLQLKDSLILAQRKLEKWADDLQVEHQKAVGFWDYDKIRNQNTPLTPEELTYMEYDTLAGVECIDRTLIALNKHIYSVPMTATGIPREQTRKRGGKAAHEQFERMALTLRQYHKFECIFHGGFTHGNRHFINMRIDKTNLIPKDGYVTCRDFASSYPYVMLAFKFPMEKFHEYKNCSAADILEMSDHLAFAFKFVATNIHLKDDFIPMPALQFSKCTQTINAICDNGRVLCANYVEIYINEYDLAVIDEQYEWTAQLCIDVEVAEKDYLPRWFTDYVFECFTDKTKLKGGDPVAYSIAKAKVNSLYGMTVQHSIQDDIVEDFATGEYTVKPPADESARYDEYLNKINSILPYQWGVWVTSIAFYNLHQLIKCCKTPLYSDTDSCYGIGWDMDKVNAYNQGCKDKLTANGYGCVEHNGREYWLGIAETSPGEDDYTEFKYVGAKRYCGRNAEDGKLHITVAGVPKKNGAACLKDDINNFSPGFIFAGTETGKTTHVYLYNEKYVDENGNETGDSISLTPCDYELDSIAVYDWESLFKEEVTIQVYDEY